MKFFYPFTGIFLSGSVFAARRESCEEGKCLPAPESMPTAHTLDIDCENEKAAGPCKDASIDVTTSEIITADIFEAAKHSSTFHKKSTLASHGARQDSANEIDAEPDEDGSEEEEGENSEAAAGSPAELEYITYSQPKRCDVWLAATRKHGSVCFAYHIELMSNGMAHFKTEMWLDHSGQHQLKYGVGCGLLDAAGRVYTLARSGHLWGNLLYAAVNRGKYQVRDDYILNDELARNWADIKRAAVPSLGKNWGEKPYLVCKPNLSFEILHHREVMKYVAMSKLDKELEEFGPIHEYVNLFI